MRPIIKTLSNNISGSTVYTDPLPLDIHGRPEVSLQVTVTGAANWTVQQTLDNPYTTPAGSITWVDHPDTNMVAQTVTRQANYAYVPFAVRLALANGSTGSATLTIVQSGITG